MEKILVVLLLLLMSELISGVGHWGGTWYEDILETPIDYREPRSFPTTEWHVARPNFPLSTPLTLANGEIKTLGNFEKYVMDWWYETREVNASCPVLPEGFGTRTDWTLNQLCLFGNVTPEGPGPKTIFVETHMLPHFAESTLKFMPRRFKFILISAGADRTIPNSTGDERYVRQPLRNFRSDYNGHLGANFAAIINDHRVLHWFAENRDIEHPKLSTLPTGFTGDLLNLAGDQYISPDYEGKNVLPLHERPLTVLVSDRSRDHRGQWYDRAHVLDLCAKHDWCENPAVKDNFGIPHEAFVQKLHQHAFVTCVHGGGVDPSPKAFEAIHEGTIPILKKSIVYDAYSHLPVAWVDSWDELFHEDNRTALLSQWVQELGPYYEKGSALRQKTLNKLKMSYWVEVVEKKYELLAGSSANHTDKIRHRSAARRKFLRG
eukprot:GSChrysophyteH1.ASY1.ANO1.1055.1 assembled CDS